MPYKIVFSAAIAALLVSMTGLLAGESPDSEFREAERLRGDGELYEAAALYRRLIQNPDATGREVARALELGLQTYAALQENGKSAELLEEAAKAWPKNWRVLASTAKGWMSLDGSGMFVDNEFVRSNPELYRRGGGRYANAFARDRVQAIRLFIEAEKLLEKSDEPANEAERIDFYVRFADAVRGERQSGNSWRLTALTDLVVLPEYGDYSYFNGGGRGAPVDKDGQPLYYSVPDSWEAAENDGQRWRWILARMGATAGRRGTDRADLLLAKFLAEQFGVQTAANALPSLHGAELKNDEGVFAVRTLSESETIARLANGVKRFTLPDEFNHIAILKRLADAQDGDERYDAAALLAGCYENRQQYHKAVRMWDIAAAGNVMEAKEALKRITGNNGLLESMPTAPAGTRPRVPYLFRNGDSVVLTAYRLDEEKLLSDIRREIKKDDEEAYRNPAIQSPSLLGRLVVERDATGYIAEKTAEWEVKLDPLPDYCSRRTAIEMPFSMAGCYLVEAAMKNGNTARVILWIADLTLIRKAVPGGELFFVADAVTGAPAGKANISFFGYNRTYRDNNQRPTITINEFAELADENGLAFVPGSRLNDREWLFVARSTDGRMAYLGFNHLWFDNGRGRTGAYSGRPNSLVNFLITDRPVYRPNQEVHFKIWSGRPSYLESGKNEVRGGSIKVTIRNPMWEAVYDKVLAIDEQGGVADSLVLDTGAPLGVYMVTVGDNQVGTFRLEEYRKPEFEVTVETPDKGLRLGDSAQAKITAKYYFGSPVANAKVSYKVLRSSYDGSWYPPWRWDWLYGPGSSWQTYDYSWYPGWKDWGTAAPLPPWSPRFYEQPELVAEGEGVLDDEGVFRLPIDTAAVKELYGDRDHKYEITVEVTDQSRRVITGSGQVIAVRKPFTATVWGDRGFYLVGQEMKVFVKARLPLGEGVKARGKATLYRISYDQAGTPTEREVTSWDVETDDGGSADLRLSADAPGQYRLSYVLADTEGNRVEGAAILAVRGEKGEGDFHFNSLELVADQTEYRPGDTLRLAVNSANSKAVVLLFTRIGKQTGKDAKPTVVRLDGGTTTLPLEIATADQPNFYCEAITVYDGKMYSEVREIRVPPADKTLKVEVKPDKNSYLPGEKATFAVKVTDAHGKPVAGECVVAVYDKSVEYISGGSNVGDIRSRFWKWRRSYTADNTASLNRRGYRVFRENDVVWQPIGVFGSLEADWNDDFAYTNGMFVQTETDAVGVRMRNSPPLQVAAAPSPEAAMDASQKNAGVAIGGNVTRRVLKMPSPAQAAPATGGGQAEMVEAAVRSEFADTALWLASLATDENGVASFSLDMPDNLTAWKSRVWTMASDVRVGDGEAEVETRKNVIVRPQTPRFLTQKDRLVLSANIHNYLPRPKTARVELVLEGGLIEAAEGTELTKEVELAAGGEARVDWLIAALRPGTAKIVMKVLTDEESDAAEVSVPVIVHGSRTVSPFGGVLRDGDGEASIRFRVPEERLADRSRLEFTFSPSIASAMLDALPFLVDYPYGCTEQTLNRFLPAVMTRRYLERLGHALVDAEQAGKGASPDAEAEGWAAKFGASGAKEQSPVFDDERLAEIVKAGVDRLSSMQNADGGWGWFSGAGERSWPHTTAVVVHGLLTARRNGVAVSPEVVNQGVDWLRSRQEEQIALLREYVETQGEKGKAKADNLDAFSYMILSGQGRFNSAMRDFLYRDRMQLSLSGLSMLGLALHAEQATEKLELVLKNIGQFVREDKTNGTAWLIMPASGWWWWYNDEVETMAWYLKLLSRTDPKGERTSGLAKYLLANRKSGSYWRSTRDTAYAVEALSEYAEASGETAPDQKVTLYLDGKQVMTKTLRAENILDDNRFVLEGLAVEAGEHELRIVREGAGNVYYGGGLDVFSLEDLIPAAGGDLQIKRSYYRLTREEKSGIRESASGTAVDARENKYRRTRIPTPFDEEGAKDVGLAPGDLIEAELTIEAKNDYEYLVFEDMKAAGLEAVELRSGYSSDNPGAYVEYRDQKVVLFLRRLDRGTHSFRYRFRAEKLPGVSALPTVGGGMYATDLRANSDEMKVKVAEDGVFPGK